MGALGKLKTVVTYLMCRPWSSFRFDPSFLDPSHFEAHGEHHGVTYLELEAGGDASLDAGLIAYSALGAFRAGRSV